MNVLFITCDQLRLDALGCYGNPIVKTPNIDALADRGVKFNHLFTAAPICSPNRGSIATGCYPSVHGLRENGMVLPKPTTTLMEILRRANYHTYGIGKMHFAPQWRFPENGGPLVDPTPDMAVDPQPSPQEMPWYGFCDVNLSEDNRVGPYADYLSEHGYDVWDDPHSFTYPQHITVQSAYPKEHYQTTWIADRSIDYLNSHSKDQPFFMWTSFVDPHHPFTPPAPYDTLYKPEDMPVPIFDPREVDNWPESYREKYFASEGGHEAIEMYNLTDADWQRVIAFYYGSITLIDDQIGRLIDTLKANNQFENTIIIFTSDHGEMLGDHHLLFKGTHYDCVTRAPFIVFDPTQNNLPSSSNTLASSIDIMPTILDMLDIPVPDTVQGVSLESCFRTPDTEICTAVLIEHQDNRRGMRTKENLIVWHGPGKTGELYNLKNDPNCLRNLWNDTEYTSKKQELMDQLFELVVNNNDPSQRKIGPC